MFWLGIYEAVPGTIPAISIVQNESTFWQPKVLLDSRVGLRVKAQFRRCTRVVRIACGCCSRVISKTPGVYVVNLFALTSCVYYEKVYLRSGNESIWPVERFFLVPPKRFVSKKTACHSVKISILFKKQNKLVRSNNADWLTKNNENRNVPSVFFIIF